MIKTIIDLLNADDWYIGDDDIDIAKGKYQSPTNFTELKKALKRNTYNNG